jgi:hypothetical protein
MGGREEGKAGEKGQEGRGSKGRAGVRMQRGRGRRDRRIGGWEGKEGRVRARGEAEQRGRQQDTNLQSHATWLGQG